MGTGHIAGYLVTLAVGYWVLTLAKKEEKFTKTIGQLVALVILVVSLFGMVCLGASKCHMAMGSCDASSSMACPFTSGAKMDCCHDMKGMDGMAGKKEEMAPATGKKNSSAK